LEHSLLEHWVIVIADILKSDGGTRPPPASGRSFFPPKPFSSSRTHKQHARTHTHQIIITRASPNHPTQRVPGPGFVNGGLSRTEFKRACKLRLRQATAALGADHTGHLTFWTCESAGAGRRVHSPTAGWGVDWRVLSVAGGSTLSSQGRHPCPLAESRRPGADSVDSHSARARSRR